MASALKNFYLLLLRLPTSLFLILMATSTVAASLDYQPPFSVQNASVSLSV
jgi:hypothetical protein